MSSVCAFQISLITLHIFKDYSAHDSRQGRTKALLKGMNAQIDTLSCYVFEMSES